ncbi:MAG: hypothetical protein ABR576_15705 [Thermoanaerobaculia bacterium]
MRARYYCPDCLAAREFTEPLTAADPGCARCGRAYPVRPDGALGGAGVERCVFCGNRAFFVQKDFDQRIGCLLMALSLGLAVFIGWRFGWIWFTPALLASVVVDWIVATRIGAVTICYRCDAEYRDVPLNSRHRAHDPHIAERYAKKRTVRRMR